MLTTSEVDGGEFCQFLQDIAKLKKAAVTISYYVILIKNHS